MQISQNMIHCVCLLFPTREIEKWFQHHYESMVFTEGGSKWETLWKYCTDMAESDTLHILDKNKWVNAKVLQYWWISWLFYILVPYRKKNIVRSKELKKKIDLFNCKNGICHVTHNLLAVNWVRGVKFYGSAMYICSSKQNYIFS